MIAPINLTVALGFSIVGLVLDIAGAVLLVGGLLWRDMAVFRAMEKVMKSEPGPRPLGWLKKVPLEIAFCYGSRDVVANTSPDMVSGYVFNFWGIVLLVFGFIFQAVGQILSTGGPR